MNTSKYTTSLRTGVSLLAALAVGTYGYAQAPGTEDEVIRLGVFEVTSEQDFGYLATNALTATRIGARIMDTPLNISVLSEEFIKDAGITNISDVLRWQSSTAGDNQMGILQPATGFTPSGIMSNRGFPINARLRDSLPRYTLYTLDTIDRVEIVKGPASVFFGRSFPGGVINYVTKKPLFAELPTTMSYRIGTPWQHRFTFDQNTVLADNVAFRAVGAWENSNLYRQYEYRHGFTVAPSLLIRATDRITILAQIEHTERKENIDNATWMWPAGWFQAYQSPPANLLALHGRSPNNPADVEWYRARIFNPGAGQNNYWTDVRNAAGDQGIPRWTAWRQGPEGAAGLSRKWNGRSPGALSDTKVTTVGLTFDYNVTDWLDIRYSFQRDKAFYYERRNQTRPNADGVTYNSLVELTWRYYDQEMDWHSLDFVIDFDVAGVKNKFLFGGLYNLRDGQFGGNSPFGADYRQIPGFGFDPNFPPGVGPNTSAFARMVQNDRFGRPMTPQQLFTEWDPNIHPYPDISRITETTRGLIDRYRPKETQWYLNYQGTLLDDRLHLMAGWREEKTYNRQQQMKASPPWFIGFENMLDRIDPADYATWQISEAYQRSLLDTRAGDSYMLGAAYNVTPEFTIYGSHSKSFQPNGGNMAIYNEADVRQRATQLGLNPDSEVARIRAGGADSRSPNEKGLNYEVGFKASLDENRVVATVSVYRAERRNERLDDSPRQNNDPLNYDAQGNRTANIIRWFSMDAIRRTEGVEFDVIWTPMPNYQAVISGGYMWTAKTIAQPNVLPDNVNFNAIFNTRIVNAPKYTFRYFNRYTFTEGALEGVTLGGGARYTSELVISNSRDWDASRGGLTAGDFIVFDAFARYTTTLSGVPVSFTLNVDNLLDKAYSEGGWNLAPGRTLFLTTEFRF